MADPVFTSSQPPIPRNTHATLSSTPLPTPTHGAFGSFSIISSLHIAAPPDTVLAILLDHSAWASWNRFVPRVTIKDASSVQDIHKGTRMTFEVHLDPDNQDPAAHSKQDMEVTVLEPFGGDKTGWRVAWTGTSMPALLLKTERVQEFVDDGEGGTEYTCWETMGGPLAPVVKWTVGAKLEKGFQAWSEGLKEQAEKKVKSTPQ